MPAKSALTDVEIALLDHLVKDKAHVRSKTISNYLTKNRQAWRVPRPCQ
jgi:hypothetical protein